MAGSLKRRDLFIGLGIAGLGLGVATLARRRDAATAKPFEPPAPPGPEPQPGKGWVDADAPRRIREIARPIEELTGWDDLGDFLTAVAWTESRGNPGACHGACAANSAHGWFQLRPNSARIAELGLPREALFDEPTSVALAAWYGHRLRPFAASGQVIDNLALRRGWAYPSRVSDVDEKHQRSKDTRARFSTGIAKAGLPQSFMYSRTFPEDYTWPGAGIDALLSAVGRPRIA